MSHLASHCLLLLSFLLLLNAIEVKGGGSLPTGEIKKRFQDKQSWKKFVLNLSEGYDEIIRTLIVSCKKHYYKNRDGKCEPCRLCVPPEVTLLYCSSNRDTICRQLKGMKSENLYHLPKKSQIEIFSPWKHEKAHIKSSHINFTMLAKRRRKRQNALNERSSENGTTVSVTEKALHPGVESPETASNSTGTSSWVYITIGVGLVAMLVIIFIATMLYRRRKSSQRQSRAPKRNSPPESYIACSTRGESANESGFYEAQDVGRNLRKDYHDSGDVYELKTLTRQEQIKESSRSFDAPLSVSPLRRSLAFGESSVRYPKMASGYPVRTRELESLQQFPALPRVKVINSASSTHSSDTTSSLLRSCYGQPEHSESNRKGHIFRPCTDDKLRGGNIEFGRCYEDVFVNNDLDCDRSMNSRPKYSYKKRSTEELSGRNYQKNDPTKITTDARGSSHESYTNVRKVSSHHSARSYISIPPTIPSEKYVGAGTDNLSIHSEHSTPPGKLEWLTKSFKFFPKNELGSYQSSFGTQTDSNVAEPKCKTVFGTQWQFGGSFGSNGGTMQAKNSDVALHVPSNAIPRGEFVDIFGAVFIETQEIRKKFEFPAGESLITPLVEYHAEPSACFHRPLCIQMPHSLPEDFEISNIKVYAFTTDDRGKVLTLRCLPFKTKVNEDKNQDGFWEKSSDAHSIDIITKHFSGYFCSLCETSSLPSICTMVFGSHVQMNPTRREVRVMLYIWDRRLTIRDYLERFRKLESDVDRQLLTDMQVPLLDSASSESRLVMKMEPMGDEKERACWRHICRPNSKWPLFKPLQVRKLNEIVHCCRQTDPIRVEWALENVPNLMPSTVFQCCIDIMHAHESTRDYETAMREDSDDLIRTFYIRDLKVTGAHEASKIQEFHHADIKRTLSEVMDPEETERVCQEFGITTRDIGNFRKKFSASDILQMELVEECLRRHGQEIFLQKLPSVLEKLQMTRVIEELEDRNVKLVKTIPPQLEPSSYTEPKVIRQNADVDRPKSLTQAKSPYKPSAHRLHLSNPPSKNTNNSAAASRDHRAVSCQERSALSDDANQLEHSEVSKVSCDGGPKCGHCADKTRNSSSGSDSVLRDSSVQSVLPSSLSIPSSSLIAEGGSDESCSIPVNKDLLTSYFDTHYENAEMQDDLRISNSGPHAISSPDSEMTYTRVNRHQGSSSSSNQNPSSKQRSNQKPRLADLDQTQKKELYGVQTIV